MEQDKGIPAAVKVKHAIIAGAQFPNVFLDMLGYGAWQKGPILRQQIDVKQRLIVLNPGIFVRRTLAAQFLKEIPDIRCPGFRFIKLDGKHNISHLHGFS